MIHHIKKHGKYIVGVGAEKLFLVGGILMTIRGICGSILGHQLSSRERFCYISCGVSDHLSFIVPAILHGEKIVFMFQAFEWSMEFWRNFGSEIIYISIWYTIFTALGWFFYVLSKPSQIKKVIEHFRSKTHL